MDDEKRIDDFGVSDTIDECVGVQIGFWTHITPWKFIEI